jgi:hypothetical protein
MEAEAADNNICGWYQRKKPEKVTKPEVQRRRREKPEDAKPSLFVYCFDKETALIEKGMRLAVAVLIVRPSVSHRGSDPAVGLD